MAWFKDNLLFPSFTALVFAADQVSKALVLHTNFPHVLNSGGAFGILSDFTLGLTLVSIVILVLVLILRPKNLRTLLPISLILGGGFSNLVDRVRQGYVVDFIDLKIWPSLTWLSPSLTRWPVFNLADAAIVVGIIILASQFVFPRKVE